MLKTTSGIYAIVNTVTGKLYIGSSKNIENRLAFHKKALSRGNHPNRHLQNSVNKHGISSFLFYVVYEVNCSAKDLLKYENLLILSENPRNLYNMVCPLQFHSENLNYQDFQERKVRKWKETVAQNGGLPGWTDLRKKEHSEKVSGEKNGFYGKSHDDAARETISEKAKQRWSNPEERLRQSDRRKKYFEDPEARRKVGESSKGRKQPLHQNEKKSQMYLGSGNPNAQPVHFDGVVYGSLKEASEALGMSKYKLKKLLKPNDYLERE